MRHLYSIMRTDGINRETCDPQFSPAQWMSAGAYYHAGGETSIDGVEQRNAANTLRLGGLGPGAWAG
jgi:hypothetical protein